MALWPELVGITAGCAFVDTWAAVVIGLIAGVIMIFGVRFVRSVLKTDDPVGAVTVHGICGAWGLLAGRHRSLPAITGVEGLIVGNAGQLLPQIIGIVAAIVWGFGGGFILFKVLDLTMGLRVDEGRRGRGPGHHRAWYGRLSGYELDCWRPAEQYCPRLAASRTRNRCRGGLKRLPL